MEQIKEVREKILMLRTNWDIVGSRGSVKEASRKWWRLSIAHARKVDYVFAVIDDIVQDIFKINKITEKKYNGTDCLNFMGERVVFDFSPAPEAIAAKYKGKLLPDEYISWGQNPVKYSERANFK